MKTEQPDNFVFNQLISGFVNELHELLGNSWCECTHHGFDKDRIERALLLNTLTKICDLAIEGMGPEECARFISAVVNERLKSHQCLEDR
jgi:hypothetical protein